MTRSGERGCLECLEFALTISLQVFLPLVRYPESAPNDHQKKPHSLWQELVVNIANDMCLRLQNNLTALKRTRYFAINDYALGCNGSGDMSPVRDHEGSAVKLAVNPPVDLH